MTSGRGRCICGGVKFTAAGLRDVLNCHCHRCRRFTGHHMAATGAAAGDVVFTAEDTLTWHSPEPTVEYGFCSTCGSSLFWRTSARPGWLSICAGSLDQPSGLRTTAASWMAEHADYHIPEPGLIETEYDG
jgi:hypothetical protein